MHRRRQKDERRENLAWLVFRQSGLVLSPEACPYTRFQWHPSILLRLFLRRVNCLDPATAVFLLFALIGRHHYPLHVLAKGVSLEDRGPFCQGTL